MRGDGPSRVSGGLLLDLEPSVNVFGEESYLALLGWEAPDLVDLDEDVPEF